MITPEGWLDWATRMPGPTDKQYAQRNSAQGYVPHSAVGYYGGWASRLFSGERGPDGRYTPYAAASVHGWISYDGTVIQHYPFTSSCWASGNFHANTNFIAFENEGGFDPHDEPLTPEQVITNVRLIEELMVWRDWLPKRPANPNDTTATLYEHNECVTLWGGSPTACPSDRIPWNTILKMLAATPAADPVLLEDDSMPAFVKLNAADDDDDPGRVWIITANTKRKLYGTRPDLAQQLGIPQIVTVIQQKTLDSLIEVGA